MCADDYLSEKMINENIYKPNKSLIGYYWLEARGRVTVASDAHV